MSNQYRVSGNDCFMTIRSKTYGDMCTVFDVDDLEKVSLHTWSISKFTRGGFYAVTHNKYNGGKTLLLHRLVTDERFEIVDHKDRDTLNNRKCNLREANAAQNTYNSGVRSNNKLGIKGVHFLKATGKYRALIFKNGKRIHLGCFYTAEEAAAAYNEASKEHFGEFSPTCEVKYA